MRTLLAADGCLYRLADPDAPTEQQFETAVLEALCGVYPQYRCIVFHGTFRYDDRLFQPDLALIARDLSHWFIVEVELISHSFAGHVLPQVKAFRYGEPQSDCAHILAGELGIGVSRARTFIEYVPRSVAVIANRRDPAWGIALASHDIQLLTVSVFEAGGRGQLHEIDGGLEVLAEHLGFGTYSAVDKSLRFAKTTRIPCGSIQLVDTSGAVSNWTVAKTDDAMWIRKDAGVPTIEPGAYVQIVRTVGGRLLIR